jgi:FkbH-like protein
MGTSDLDRALAARSLAEIRESLRPRSRSITFADMKRLTQAMRSLDAPLRPTKVAVVRTYTTELLRPYWEFESLLNGLTLDIYEAPYGLVVQEAAPDGAAAAHGPDVLFLLLQWSDLDPRLAGSAAALSGEERDSVTQAATQEAVGVLSAFRQALACPLVLAVLPSLSPVALGICDIAAPWSERLFRCELVRAVAVALRDSVPDAHLADLDDLATEVGRSEMFDLRTWHMGRFPFSVRGAQAVVRRLTQYLVLFTSTKTKCVVLDADNTLWGGVVGEDGPRGIALGPEYPGNVYVAFQRRLAELKHRGLLLGLCSKNNPDDVLEVLRDHPHQVLREGDFASIRANWEDKADNLLEMANELKLGLESFMFIDDSPQECLALRARLPEVTTICLPSNVDSLPYLVDDLPQLQTLGLTAEDGSRAEMYSQERERRALATTARTVEDYLSALQMRMSVRLNDETEIPRLAQLTQKTNQFNLTTRRYSESQIAKLVGDPDTLVAHFTLSDTFGDSGIVGLAIVGLSRHVAEFDTFLLSCRVIGRTAETAFLNGILQYLVSSDIRVVRGAYASTPKNALVEDFWTKQGFAELGSGSFELDLTTWQPCPAPAITVVAPPEPGQRMGNAWKGPDPVTSGKAGVRRSRKLSPKSE